MTMDHLNILSWKYKVMMCQSTLFRFVTSCKSHMQYLFLTTLFLYATKQVVLQVLWLFILDLYIRPSLGVYYGPFMDGIVHNCN